MEAVIFGGLLEGFELKVIFVFLLSREIYSLIKLKL